MNQKGITLITLVITIIVLLILAGISIAMLTGENGILTKVDRAQEETEKQEIIEEARIDILEKQTENLGKLTEKELIDILTPSYGTLSGEGTVLEKTLTTTDGKYSIPVKEIYTGLLSKEKGTCYVDGTELNFILGDTWEDKKDWLTTYLEGYNLNSSGIFFNGGGATYYLCTSAFKPVYYSDMIVDGSNYIFTDVVDWGN